MLLGKGQSRAESDSLDEGYEAARYLTAIKMIEFFSSATGTDAELLFQKLSFKP